MVAGDSGVGTKWKLIRVLIEQTEYNEAVIQLDECGTEAVTALSVIKRDLVQRKVRSNDRQPRLNESNKRFYNQETIKYKVSKLIRFNSFAECSSVAVLCPLW